jgi:uncharacterized protein YbjT (DUF2867 family)
VEVRKGDYSQPLTLDAAFAGGDKLLIVSYPSIAYEVRVNSHKAAIDAAKRVGIKHVYYTSLMFAGDSQAAVMQAHSATEKYLKERGLPYTIIREGIYSESYPLYFGYWKPGREGSEVKVPYGDGGIAWVCRDDLGEGTAKLIVAVRLRVTFSVVLLIELTATIGHAQERDCPIYRLARSHALRTCQHCLFTAQS